MYCSRCGVEIPQKQWKEVIYCFSCGSKILKGSDSVKAVPIPSRSTEYLSVATGRVTNHPVLTSVGSIGVGAAGIAVSPLLMVAGQWLLGVGIGVAILSLVVDSLVDDEPCKGGVKLGLGIAAGGFITQGAGYIVLTAGVVTATAGVGLGAYTGLKAIAEHRKAKLIHMHEPLMLEGGNYEQG